ncbi:MAG: amidohydrolase family protein [bacterium]
MIVDAHCHIWPERIPEGSLLESMHATAEHVGFKSKDHFMNASIERLIAEMDEGGIDKAVLIGIDFEPKYAAGTFTTRDFNNLIGEAFKKFPGRIVPYAGIDPRRGAGAIQELKRCVLEMGFKGMKLWPLTGFFPDDESYYPLYQEAARLGIHIAVHTGLGPPDSYLKTCRPIYVDKLAVDFREIHFILAHLGTPWWEEAFTIAAKNSNVYVDISAWQKMHAHLPTGFYQVLSVGKLTLGGVHKILFGTDFPALTEIYSQKDWVSCIRNLEYPPPLQIMGLPEITEEDKQRILGENAAAAFGL